MITTRANFDIEIRTLQDKILEMATCADNMLGGAVDALVSGNIDLATSVIRQDDTVDQLDVEIENRSLLLIATQQPVARDLRIIGTAIKVITDIERIADYAVDIAKIGRRIARAEELYRPLVDIPLLSQRSRSMFRDALQAFVHQDLELVDKVINDDDAVDNLYHQMRTQLTELMQRDPSRSLLAMNVLFAAKYLERVSDHVVNIAERVSFIETGELIQHYHPSKQTADKAV